MTTTTSAGPAPPLPAARLLALTVAVAAAVALLPTAAAAIAPEPAEPVAPSTTVTVPLPEMPAFRMTAPAGWVESAVPAGPDRGLVYTRGTDTLTVYATTRVRGDVDADAYAARLARVAAARSGITAVPDGRATGPDGLAGPRLRVTATDGATGELVVLARGPKAVGMLVLTDPARPFDLRPVVDSLRAVAA